MQMGGYRRSRDAEDARDFGANSLCNFLVAQFAKLGIGGAACKAGEANHPFRCAPCEESRVEHRSENAQPFGTRDQETKSVGKALHLLATIARGHNCNRRVFDSRK